MDSSVAALLVFAVLGIAPPAAAQSAATLVSNMGQVANTLESIAACAWPGAAVQRGLSSGGATNEKRAGRSVWTPYTSALDSREPSRIDGHHVDISIPCKGDEPSVGRPRKIESGTRTGVDILGIGEDVGNPPHIRAFEVN